jgi:hypothetical protein
MMWKMSTGERRIGGKGKEGTREKKKEGDKENK